MEKTAILLSQYCDNDLSDEERPEFVEWMKKDAAHVERFVRLTFLHSLLYDLAKEQDLQSNAWSHVLGDREPYIPDHQGVSSARVSQPTNRRTWMTAVAAILMGVSAATALHFSLRSPDLVAQVSSLQGSATTSSGQKLLAGAFLPQGETFQVDDGSLLLTFECGAKVLIEGPALFVVESDSTGSLVEGMASTRIPTQAIGFAIHTPLLEIIDLGTEFQAKILNDHQVELHVFDGLVEVRLDKRFEHADDAPLSISEGRSALFDLATNEIVTLEYDESLKRDF